MNHNTKSNYNQEVESNGYAIINDVFSNEETQSFIYEIEQISDSLNKTFRKSKDLFAIRQFLKEVPTINKILFNDALKNILGQLLGNDYFVVKSIYFDKPEQSNWFVSYHQDLTISVDKKLECSGFNNWTIKQNQFSVQPTEKILENIFTIRIHLDDTDEKNGALRIIPKSHANGIVRLDSFDFNEAEEQIAKVKKGGIMIMKPLLFHASNKTINNEKRRVIHVEFSNLDLPEGISWSEKINI
ncbi:MULTISPECIES: phytanoyl-CoA dioxygenase family protein [Flavobacterium]|uniref:Phytanoyl-CoA dioxygenase family protein n=1 Tax=Flavobacterium jumunjinense TaxID=998845 RepID=A0ABV5GRD4_9FLAO|nr:MULTISPECIES: phytanoyl-CoA dioxygenase family protein [Flavobacterium]